MASRPDHFKRFLRFQEFLNLAISDSVNEVMQNQNSSSLFEDKNKIPHTPMGLLSWCKRFMVKADVLIVEFQPYLEMVHGKYYKEAA